MCRPFDLRDLLEGFSGPAAILAEGRHIVAANHRFRARFAEGEDPRGWRCHELLHDSPVPCSQHGLECPLAQCLSGNGRGQAFHRHEGRDGDEAVSVAVCEVTAGQGDVAYFLHLTQPVPNGWLPDALQSLVG